MGKPSDLETLRAIFKDDRQHIMLGKITQLGLADDRSMLRVSVSILPEEREIIASMTWDIIGDESGVIGFPEVNDLVLVAQEDGSNDSPHVVRRLSSIEERIPIKAIGGHLVVQSRAGKMVYVGSDTKVNVGRKDSDATEPLVLGNVMLAALSDMATRITTLINKLTTDPIAISLAPGQPEFAHPTLIADLAVLKLQIQADTLKYVGTSSTNVVSQVAFTER